MEARTASPKSPLLNTNGFYCTHRMLYSERNKQFVEITATCSRSTCKQFHKYQVHLYGVDHACGKYLGLYMQRVPKAKRILKIPVKDDSS